MWHASCMAARHSARRSRQAGGRAQPASQRQRVADELAHRVAHRRGRRARQVVVYLEQVRLDVRVGRVEDEICVRAARHLGHVLVSVDDLSDEDDLVLQHLYDILVLAVRVVVVARELAVDGPHLPRHALGLEGPARAALLEELQADGAARRGRARVQSAQQLGEVWDLALDTATQRVGFAADVRKVYEVTIHIDVADGADGVALFVVVSELATGAVEEDGVEDAGDDLVHLPALHGQLEGDGARVHGGGVSGRPRERPGRACSGTGRGLLLRRLPHIRYG